MASRIQIHARRWWLISIVLAASLSLTLAAVAAARVTPSESTLTFKGLITESQQRTLQLTVEGGPITNVQVIRHDLIDAKSGAVILSNEIVVEPLKIDRVEDTADLSVSLTGVKRGGHYVGRLDIRYADQGVTQTLTIALDAQLSAVPTVDATADSKTLTWFVTDQTGATQPIFLTQKAAGDAEVQEAHILVMRGGKGQSLLAGQVYTDATLPALLSPGSTLPITVGVRSGVPAGEYRGTLLVKVRDQAAALEVPLVVRAKHAPWAALLTLIAGLVTAAVLGWWNSEGQTKKASADALAALRAKLAESDRLQEDQVDAVIALIGEAVQALNKGEAAATVDLKVKAAQQALVDEQKKTDEVLAEIERQIKQATDLKPGDGVRQRFLDRLTTLRERTRKSEWKKLADAVADKADVQKDLNFWAKAVELLAKVPQADRETATKRLNEAVTLNAMQLVLKDYGLDNELIQSPLGRTFATGDYAAARLSAGRPDLELSVKTRLTVQGAALFAGVVVYVFALAVGFVTVYMANDTFGADAQHYLSLFLWAAVVETVRGKAITLTELQTSFGPKLGQPAAPAAPAANPVNPKPPTN